MHWLAALATVIAGAVAMRRRASAPTREIMFWSESSPPSKFAGRLRDVPPGDALLAISVLRAGRPVQAYLGWADCRICGATLGTQDMGALGFVWPEKAEHYVEAHEVWTPELGELVAAAKTKLGT